MPLGYSLVRLPWSVQRKAWLVAAYLSDDSDPFSDVGIVAAIEAALDAYLATLEEGESEPPGA